MDFSLRPYFSTFNANSFTQLCHVFNKLQYTPFFYRIRAFSKDLYFHVYSYFTVYSSIKSKKHTSKMAVPNRGTSGTCDQAIAALETALEVCTLPFSMSMVYLIVALSLVPSTCTSRLAYLCITSWPPVEESSYSLDIYHVLQVCCMCTAYYLCQYSPL